MSDTRNYSYGGCGNEFEMVPLLPATEALLQKLPPVLELLKQAKYELEKIKSEIESVKSNKRQDEDRQLQSEIRQQLEDSSRKLEDEKTLHQTEVHAYKAIEKKLNEDLIQLQHTLDKKTKECEKQEQKLKERSTTSYGSQQIESAKKAADYEKRLRKEAVERSAELQKFIEQRDRAIAESKLNATSQDSEMKQLKAELDETKTRLSKMMGTKLSDNNPNITDLSDKNRPSKLGERFQELYDNQWTDAYEQVEKSYPNNERDSVGVLLKILLAVKTFCENEAKWYEEQMNDALFSSNRRDAKPIPDFVNKALKDCRKAMAMENVDYIHERFLSRTPKTTRRGLFTHRLSSFVRECVEVCWLMTLQDPPVVFGSNVEQNSPFDTNVYRSYTTSGTKIDYVVWPAIYLYKGGPILAKGVAQGYKTERVKSAPPDDQHSKHQFNKREQHRAQSASTGTRSDAFDSHGRDQMERSGANSFESSNDPNTFETTKGFGHTFNTRTNTGAGYQQLNVQTTLAQARSIDTRNASSNYDRKKYESPSSIEINNYLYYLEQYGEKRARRLMGARFDVCYRHFARLESYA